MAMLFTNVHASIIQSALPRSADLSALILSSKKRKKRCSYFG